MPIIQLETDVGVEWITKPESSNSWKAGPCTLYRRKKCRAIQLSQRCSDTHRLTVLESPFETEVLWIQSNQFMSDLERDPVNVRRFVYAAATVKCSFGTRNSSPLLDSGCLSSPACIFFELLPKCSIAVSYASRILIVSWGTLLKFVSFVAVFRFRLHAPASPTCSGRFQAEPHAAFPLAVVKVKWSAVIGLREHERAQSFTSYVSRVDDRLRGNHGRERRQ